MNIGLTTLSQALALLALALLVLGVIAIVALVRRLSMGTRAPERLTRLDALRKSGAITADEYARQRASIISKL